MADHAEINARPITKKWPPKRGERYIGRWPPKFKTPPCSPPWRRPKHNPAIETAKYRAAMIEKHGSIEAWEATKRNQDNSHDGDQDYSS